MEKTTLVNIAGGRAQTEFNRALNEVLANIADPRMPAKTKRSIVMSIVFEPNETRQQFMVSIRADTKLAKAGEAKALVYAGLNEEGEEIEVFNQDPAQQKLLGDFEAARARTAAGEGKGK